eukprot:SAG31_NODE_37738_length_301_cov_5.554455_1_plen_68_part_10
MLLLVGVLLLLLVGVLLLLLLLLGVLLLLLLLGVLLIRLEGCCARFGCRDATEIDYLAPDTKRFTAVP